MSGHVATERYMMEPTADMYSTFFMAAVSSGVVGDIAEERLILGSMGVVTGALSAKL